MRNNRKDIITLEMCFIWGEKKILGEVKKGLFCAAFSVLFSELPKLVVLLHLKCYSLYNFINIRPI